MFSFILHISEGKLGLICFDLLTESCPCHRHRLPLCPFSHQSISVDKVFPKKTELPLWGTVQSHGHVLQPQGHQTRGMVVILYKQHIPCIPTSKLKPRPGDIWKRHGIKQHPVFGGGGWGWGQGKVMCVVICSMLALCYFLMIELYSPPPSQLR